MQPQKLTELSEPTDPVESVEPESGRGAGPTHRPASGLSLCPAPGTNEAGPTHRPPSDLPLCAALGTGEAGPSHRPPSDLPFFLVFGVIAGAYVVLILIVLLADSAFSSGPEILRVLHDADIQYSIKLSLFSCTVTAVLSVLVAVPVGYLLSRHLMPLEHDRYADQAGHPRLRFWVGHLVDTILDVPVVLPPLVIGLSLLILFQIWPFRYLNREVTYEIPAVIIAQFMVASAFAVRTMRVTFDQIPPRHEQIAWTLGCSRGQAFWRVALPASRRGILAAATIAWARALGEFGPILVFAGATRGRTEVLSTTVFLELSIGRLEAAVTVSLLMVAAAVVVLVVMRVLGLGVWGGKA